MNDKYNKTLEFLYEKTPMFQLRGAAAYKPGLDVSIALNRHFDCPNNSYKSILVVGTNGKGSTSHSLASILQLSGYKVGLFTSPHLLDFSERIRVNGEAIEQKYVIDFVEEAKELIEGLSPSFFELTTIMALKYFKDKKVDIAVIEAGMGARLDTTAIIDPILSIITNVSLDHTQFLGDSLEKIAYQKAGAIRNNIYTIVGRKDRKTDKVFEEEAQKYDNSKLIFSEDYIQDLRVIKEEEEYSVYNCSKFEDIESELSGLSQIENMRSILTAVDLLSKENIQINKNRLSEALRNVRKLTGLRGRWEIISQSPYIVIDTAHNIDGIAKNIEHIKKLKKNKVRIILAMAKDKDIDRVMSLLPKEYSYYFTKFKGERACPPSDLLEISKKYELKALSFDTLEEAYNLAENKLEKDDLLFIGGSNFIIAEFLALFE